MLSVWYKALTQNYLDLNLRPTSGVTARIVERPGLWMPQQEIDALLGDLRRIARTTLPDGDLNYGILTGDRDRLAKSIVTILHDRKTGAPVAFNALAVMDVDLHAKPAEVLHMGLVMVDPGVRSQGFSWVLYGLTCLVLFFRNQMRPLWLSNVTQVPAILGMVTETFSNVFPSPKAEARRSFEHVLLARAIMSHHRYVFGVGMNAGFDEKRFVITNAYTGGSDDLKKTFDSAPKHRDQVYNEFCRRELDYDRGDDVLQLCQLSLETARRFVLKDVPRRSLPAVLGILGFVALNKLVLPVAYWLTPDRPWGDPQALRDHRDEGEMKQLFDYQTFTTRNIGFVTEAEQAKLRTAKVFVCGTGGMGGAALMALARAGVGHFVIADLDEFEVSNLNRQVFAFTDTVGRHKAEASAEILQRINPEIVVQVLKADWPTAIDRIAKDAQVIVNGTDDLAASLLLYRTARAAGLAVVDAYASPLPSVYVTRPHEPMPEERLGYPTREKAWNAVTKEDRAAAFRAEAVHVLVHSTSRKHIDLDAAGEVAAGKRSRMSFAPMVISTGMMIAYEVVALILSKPTGTDCRGYFFNPHRPAVERPKPWIIEASMKPVVRRFLERMMRGA